MVSFFIPELLVELSFPLVLLDAPPPPEQVHVLSDVVPGNLVVLVP